MSQSELRELGFPEEFIRGFFPDSPAPILAFSQAGLASLLG